MQNNQVELQQELAAFIIEALKLDIVAAEINPTTPLFGSEGLGLDSIDILELAFALSKKYGISIKSGDSRNIEIFANVAALANYVSEYKKI